MSRLRSLAGTVAVLAGAALCAVPAGAAACSNEASREAQHAGYLPDCRAYELVSPVDKNGGEVMTDSTRTRSAVDGSAVAYSSLVAFGDAMGTGVAAEYMAQRSSDPNAGGGGWGTHAITPLQEALSVSVVTSSYEPLFTVLSGDLSEGVFQSWGPLTQEPYVAEAPNLYARGDVRTAGVGSYTLMSPCPVCVANNAPLGSVAHTAYAGYPSLAGVSEDFKRVLFESTARLTADANANETTGLYGLYESDGATTRLVDRIPSSGSECIEPACVVPSQGAMAGQGTVRRIGSGDYTPHVLSADGARAVFTVPNGAQCSLGTCGILYLREMGVSPERTVQIAPQTAVYWDANMDGSRIFLTSGAGLYVYEPDAAAGQRLTLIAPGGEALVGASEDGRYAYLLGSSQIVEGAPQLTDGAKGLFVWRDGPGGPASGEVSYIGELASKGLSLGYLESDLPADLVSGFSNGPPQRQTRVSADGRHLLFFSMTGTGLLSVHGGMDYDQEHCAAALHGFCSEIYYYSADTNQLRCVSCRRDGLPAGASAFTQARVNTGATHTEAYENRAISADGRFAFFSTAEPLVASDTNGVSDAYEYDTATGEVHLLSSGQSPDPSYFMDATPDGRDAFISTRERLVGWDVDKANDLYDVRIGGGFPEPSPPPPACQGDACQPAPVALIDTTPGTMTFSGPGDLSKPAAHRPAGRHKHKRRSGRRHAKHKTARHKTGKQRVGGHK